MVLNEQRRQSWRSPSWLAVASSKETAMQTKTTKVLKLLYVQVLIGLALGILVGFLFPDFGASLKALGKSLGLFYILTVLSLLIGLAAVLLIKPGQGLHIDPTHLDPAVAANAAKTSPPS